MYQKNIFSLNVSKSKIEKSPQVSNIFRTNFIICYYTASCPFKINFDLSVSFNWFAKLVCGLTFFLGFLKNFWKLILRLRLNHGNNPVEYIYTLKSATSLWMALSFFTIIFKKGKEIQNIFSHLEQMQSKLCWNLGNSLNWKLKIVRQRKMC